MEYGGIGFFLPRVHHDRKNAVPNCDDQLVDLATPPEQIHQWDFLTHPDLNSLVAVYTSDL